MKRLFVSIALLCTLYSCKNNADYQAYLHNPVLYSRTVHEFSDVMMGNNCPPMIASRGYAYAAIASYEVIAAGFPQKYNSLAGQVNGMKAMPKPDSTNPIA
jgi:hypothetical protein